MGKNNSSQENSGSGKTAVIAAAVVVVLIAGIGAISMLPTANTALAGNGSADSGSAGTAKVAASSIKTFKDSGKSVEAVDGKPVIRLFSTTWCPHCKWIAQTYERVVREYVGAGKIIAYHWEIDISDNTLTPGVEGSIPESEMAVFREFNPRGSIPTFVFGGKYSRIGNGYELQDDLKSEEAEFRAVIEKLIEEAQ